MTRIDNGIDVSAGGSNTSTVLITFGLMIAGFFIGQFGSAMVAMILAIAGGVDMSALMEDPELLMSSLSQGQALTAQAFYTLFFTFATPWFYLQVVAKKSFKTLFNETGVNPIKAILILVATFAFIFVNAYVVEWNAGIDLPDGAFEDWAKSIEEQLAATTEQFTTFNNFGSFLFAFFVVAVLPGIGEELLFRGVLQNAMHRATGNAHIAIWTVGFLFAAIHLQFYGVGPRMLLGAFFGYIYIWSGNMWYPIIAHIANNGIALTFAYLAQLEIIEVNPDETDSVPVLYSILGLVVCGLLLFVFRNMYLRPKGSDGQLADRL